MAVSSKNLTMLALGLANGEPLSPVQLQKAVFLLQERLPEDVLARDIYEFIPHYYGPFCRAIYADAEQLRREGLIIINNVPNASAREYVANEHAIKHSNDMLDKLLPETVELARHTVMWVQAQSFDSLVSAIYDEYPAYRVNSIFRDTRASLESATREEEEWSNYIETAIAAAKYEVIEDERPVFGSIPGFQGVWANAYTEDECREELMEALEEWLRLRLSKGYDTPVIAGIELTNMDL